MKEEDSEPLDNAMHGVWDIHLFGDLLAWTPLSGVVRGKRMANVAERRKVESIKSRIRPILQNIVHNHLDLLQPKW